MPPSLFLCTVLPAYFVVDNDDQRRRTLFLSTRVQFENPDGIY